MRVYFLALLLLNCIPLTSFGFFCPTNFNQIDFGSTPEQVTQQCGKPDSEEIKERPGQGPQQWSYFIPQTVSSNYMMPQKGTLKTEITFDSSGKAVNISVNGIGVGSSTICGSLISLGDDRDRIQRTCGDPSFISKQNGSPSALGETEPPTKVTTFRYNTTSSRPVTLIFENGVLKERQ